MSLYLPAMSLVQKMSVGVFDAPSGPLQAYLEEHPEELEAMRAEYVRIRGVAPLAATSQPTTSHTPVSAEHLRYKVSDCPRFDGKHATAQTVHSLWAQLKLQWQCRKLADPMLFACLHLDGDAPTWRKLTLRPSNEGTLEHVSIDAFKAALFQRFVPYHLRVKALQQFKQLKQTSTVQAYTTAFQQQ